MKPLDLLRSFLPAARAAMLGVVIFSIPAIPSPAAGPAAAPGIATTWRPDNGNGTYTNPLFYDEFTDPDVIRVGDDYYLAGTTMHAMPCLVVLHSKDLVNWNFVSYAINQLDLGPEFKLENGQEAYGQGIWAPCIRYHDGTFYLFANVNHHGLQIFTSRNPAGPWQHREFGKMLHDISVLFDDDGRIYAVYNYDEVRIVELKKDLSGVVEGTDRVLIPKGNGLGEGHHFYKINGKYYIISADYAPVGRMQCARADRLDGPWESVVISARETMGTRQGLGLQTFSLGRAVPPPGAPFPMTTPSANGFGAVTMHQGGIVDLPNGDWWGISMMDFKSVGRTVFLSPVTWSDSWPYFGLPGNLGRSPRTWIKPAVAVPQAPAATYERNEDFTGPKLHPVWQWNHAPEAGKWSLTEKPGALRLHTLPAEHFLWARNTLTQRVIGPRSTATVTLDATGLQDGDVAGLGLLNIPFAWLGVARKGNEFLLRWYSQASNETLEQSLPSPRVTLRAAGDYDADVATLSFSVDGEHFTPIGGEIRLPYQLKTFQGVRYSLFAYNTAKVSGGCADFSTFRVVEPLADRSQNLPLGKIVTITNLGTGNLFWAGPRRILHSAAPGSAEAAGAGAKFRVVDKGLGRVALEALDGGGFITVSGLGLSADVRLQSRETEGSLFQWQDLLEGQFMLLSLKTHRYVGLDPATGEPYAADWSGTQPDRKGGSVFKWQEAEPSKN